MKRSFLAGLGCNGKGEGVPDYRGSGKGRGYQTRPEGVEDSQ